MKRSISRMAMALALTAGAGLMAAPAMAQELKISKGFNPVAVELQNSVKSAEGNAAVTAASEQAKQARLAVVQAPDDAARAQAQARLDAARSQIDQAMGGIRGKIDTAFSTAEKPDDRYFAGQMALAAGQTMADPALQKRGIDAMLASGKIPAEKLATYQYYSGALGYDAQDYASAREMLPKAIASGYTENEIRKMLAEAYFADDMHADGLVKLNEAIAARAATGAEVPSDWVFRGLAISANNGLDDQAFEWAMKVLENSSAPNQRVQAYSVLSSLSPFNEEEELDLLRLMQRENALSDRRHYLAYLYQADPRLRPAEAQAIINSGVAAGMLDKSDTSVADALAQANRRYDPVLGELGTDSGLARNASSGGEAMAIADVYLGYKKPQLAADLYRVALEKGGIDKDKALTGLGIALADQGKFQEAKDTFSQIAAGNRSQLARAWTAYINAQTGG